MEPVKAFLTGKRPPGRMPADIVANLQNPISRDRVWAAIRKLRRFTLLDLQKETRIKVTTMRTYVQGLTHAGYLERQDNPNDEANNYAASMWALVRDCGVEAPRVTRDGKEVVQGSGRDQMWRSIRTLKDFSVRELQQIASTSRHAIALNEALDYVKHLRNAGYLTVRGDSAFSKEARFSLIPVRNTGPKAPQVQRIKQVWDPNLGRVMPKVRGGA